MQRGTVREPYVVNEAQNEAEAMNQAPSTL